MLPSEMMSEVIDHFHLEKHLKKCETCRRARRLQQMHYVPYQTGTSIAGTRKDKKHQRNESGKAESGIWEDSDQTNQKGEKRLFRK